MPRLTAKSVEAAQPGAARREIPDELCRGLYLIVQPTGAKGWAVRYRAAGRSVKETIGAFPRMTLAAAREAALARLRLVAAGVDPRQHRAAEAERQRAAEAATFAAVAGDFVRLHCQRNNRSWREQDRLLRAYAIPVLGGRPLSEIRRAEIARLVDEIAGDKPATARLVLATVRKLFSWAIERGRIEANPASRIAVAKVARRDRVLSDDELARVWRAAEARGWPFGSLVQMLALTGCRRDELAGLRWQDVDAARGLIVIPADRYKTGVAHVVPLSRLAAEVLAGVPRIEGVSLVFAGRGNRQISGFSKRKRDLATAAAVDFCLHDVRRTVRTGLSRLRVPFVVAERVLGHVQGGVAAHYDHHDYLAEKRAALESWASHVEGLVRPAPANIVRIANRTPAAHIGDG